MQMQISVIYKYTYIYNELPGNKFTIVEQLRGLKIGTTSVWPVTSPELDSLCCELNVPKQIFQCYCTLFTIGQYVVLNVSKQ